MILSSFNQPGKQSSPGFLPGADGARGGSQGRMDIMHKAGNYTAGGRNANGSGAALGTIRPAYQTVDDMHAALTQSRIKGQQMAERKAQAEAKQGEKVTPKELTEFAMMMAQLGAGAGFGAGLNLPAPHAMIPVGPVRSQSPGSLGGVAPVSPAPRPSMLLLSSLANSATGAPRPTY